MKFKFFIITFGLLFSGITISSSQNTKSACDKGKGLPEEKRIKLEYTFVDAAREKIRGNLENAVVKFTECLKLDPNNDAAMFEIAQILLSQNHPSDALTFAKKAAELNPKNDWYLQLLASVYEKNNQNTEAVKVFQQMIKNSPQKIDNYFDLANAFLLANKAEDAIKTYNKIEELSGITPEVSIEKERIYLKQNKVDKAIDEVQRLIDTDPKETKYIGMLAELYQSKNPEKALELYNRILQIEPNNSFVHLSLADYYRTKGEKDKSFNELKIAFANKNLEVETKLRILLSYSNLVSSSKEMMDQALELCKILIDTHPNESKAHAVYGDFLYQMDNFKDAHTQFEEALKLDKQNFDVWKYDLEVDYRLNDFDLMLKESEEAISLFPTQPYVYLYNGVAKSQKDKNEDAIEIFKAGLNLVIDDIDLKERFLVSLGESYNKLKKYTESDEAYDKALELKPKDVYVLNNYSYYLSLRGEKLDKAEAMSKLSNDIKPNTSSYQDTYGWILYKEGKYTDAKVWIQKALDYGGIKNPVILEHMGDILFKLNDTAGAIKFWQDAKAAGKGSEFLDKKIADKKLYE